MRYRASAAVFLVTLRLMVTAGASGPVKTWVGTKVVTKYGTPLRVGRDVVDEDDTIRVYTVERVNGEWLWLVAGRVSGWVRSGQVVPLDQAVDYFTQEIRGNPGRVLTARAYIYRGAARYWNGENDAALADFNEAIRLDPKLARAYFHRGTVWLATQRVDAALADVTTSIDLEKTYTPALVNRAAVWRILGEFERAVGDLEDVVRLDPKNAWAHYNLAYIRATCPDARFRDGPRAVTLATRACALSAEPPFVHVATLAAAYAEVGDFARAVEWQHKANAIATDENQKSEGQERLALFEARKPYHEDPAGAIKPAPAAATGVPSAPASALATPPGQFTTVTNTIGMKLVLIPRGSFLMGAPDSDKDAFANEKPQHRVQITQPFYLGTTEVTVGQFRKVTDATGLRTEAETDGTGGRGLDMAKGELTLEPDPKFTWRHVGFTQTDEHPVLNVSWNDAVAFCNKLSALEGLKPYYQWGPGAHSGGDGYRLPTDAEWEYACRAGTTTRYPGGDDPESLALVANVADGTFSDTFGGNEAAITRRDGYVFTAPVGRFRPNGFGLYDMFGNVMEWCWDKGVLFTVDGAPVPSGPEVRVIRCGDWCDRPQDCRASARSVFSPNFRGSNLGFRVARSWPGP